MYEILVALLIVVLIVIFCHRRRHEAVVVTAVDAVVVSKGEDAMTNPHSCDKCVHGCGNCIGYNTEPILREMTFFNNIYDTEHSYERDPDVIPEFQRYYSS